MQIIIVSDQDAQPIQLEKKVFSTNHAKKSEFPYSNPKNLDSYIASY